MLASAIIGVGIFRKGYLFSKSKLAATYTLLLYLIHPLAVWFSGEPRTEHFTHSLYIAGLFLVINQNKKLLWKNLLGVLLLFISAKTNPDLYPFIVLFFIFNTFESMLSKSTLPQNYYILIGQAAGFICSCLIFLGWDNVTPVSAKILEVIEYIYGLFSRDSGAILTILPEVFDEYFRNLMKSFFSPILIIFPILILGFGKELKLSNYSRGLYSFSLLICATYLLEFKSLSTSKYEQMYGVIILSILVSAIGCHRLYNRFKYTYVRFFIILFLPLSLSFGLFGRGYRDFFRQQSVIGLMPALESHISSPRSVLYLPFGRDLNVKKFSIFKQRQSLVIKKIPHLKKQNFSKFLEGAQVVFLYVDDYFIHNFFWPGRFLLDVNNEIEIGNIVVEKLFRSEVSKNKGHLFKIKWKK